MVLPKRWILERTFVWLTRSRRLARVYERLPAPSEAMILWSMTMVMTRRLGRHHRRTGLVPSSPRRHDPTGGSTSSSAKASPGPPAGCSKGCPSNGNWSEPECRCSPPRAHQARRGSRPADPAAAYQPVGGRVRRAACAPTCAKDGTSASRRTGRPSATGIPTPSRPNAERPRHGLSRTACAGRRSPR
ncbi:transposase [Actinacidiphila acididurans]|uniref:transposase n=1 Tax=Actinacidiphila acididurans TaxID=2784346 RepID=UPI003558FFFC